MFTMGHAMITAIALVSPDTAKTPWPDDGWTKASPASQRMSAAKLADAPRRIAAAYRERTGGEFQMNHGIVVRNGLEVWRYGDPDDGRSNIASAERTMLTTLYGIAIKDGVIKGGAAALEQPAAALGTKTALTFPPAVKLKHLLTFTSCSDPPGTAWRYGCNTRQMTDILWELYDRRPEETANKLLVSALGGSWNAYWDEKQHELKYSATPSAMARWGWMWLNRGNWKGRQVVEPWFADLTITPLQKPDGSSPAREDKGWQIHLNRTGGWKGIPRDAYAAVGAGWNFILVVPSLRLVVASKGGVVVRGKDDPFTDKLDVWFAPIVDAVQTPRSALRAVTAR